MMIFQEIQNIKCSQWDEEFGFRQRPSSQLFAFVIAFVFVFLPLWLYLSSSLCCFRVHLKSLNALVTGGRGVLGISTGRGAHPFGLRLSQGPHNTNC